MTTLDDIYHDSMMSHLSDLKNLSYDDLMYLSDHLSELAFKNKRADRIVQTPERQKELNDAINVFAGMFSMPPYPSIYKTK